MHGNGVSLNLTDTHTHLYLEDYDDDRQAVVRRAVEAGVTRLLLPAVDSVSFDALHRMATDYPTLCFPMAGLHPTSVNAGFESELAFVEKVLADAAIPCIAIGEVGLDLYWDAAFLTQQVEALRCQLAMAYARRLPVVLHLRSAKNQHDDSPQHDAYELFFKIWDSFLAEHPVIANTEKPHAGVMHCFSGSVDQAIRAVQRDFYIGVGGVVTYKNAQLQHVVASVPLERILLETDAPYLAPVPYRGRRNESAYIVEVAKKIGEIKGVSLDEVAAQTSRNATLLFRLPTI